MLIIVTKNEGQTLYLRGPVWTSCIDKAAKYGTIEQATAAIEKAKNSCILTFIKPL